MRSFTWSQVNAWRLARHFLHERAERTQMLDVVRRVGALQAQGWISAVVLVNGRIEGVWQHERKRAQTVVTVSPFAPPSGDVKQGIETEAARLGAFLGTEAQVVYAP